MHNPAVVHNVFSVFPSIICNNLAGIPVEGKSPVCMICMKYRIIILIIYLVKIFLSYIANTSRTHARYHARTHAHMYARMHTPAHACARTRAHTCKHFRRRRTGYRYSVAPNRDGPLRLRQCRSLAIQINTRHDNPISPRFWMFFEYNNISTTN